MRPLGLLERSHSGLVRALGERMLPQGDRGFESPPLRSLCSPSWGDSYAVSGRKLCIANPPLSAYAQQSVGLADTVPTLF